MWVDDIKLVAEPGERQRLLRHMEAAELEVTQSTNNRFVGLTWDYDLEEGVCRITNSSYIEELAAEYDLSEVRRTRLPGVGHLPQADESAGEFPGYCTLAHKLAHVASVRPDIKYACKELLRHLQRSTEVHWRAALRVLKYVACTSARPLILRRCDGPLVVRAFCDASWANCEDTRRGTGGVVLALGTSAIHYWSRTQHAVARSSAEAEVYNAMDGCLEVHYLRRVLNEIGYPQDLPSDVFLDATAAIALLESKHATSLARHVDIRRRRAQELLHDKVVSLRYCPTDHMPADILTKNLGLIKHDHFATMLLDADLPLNPEALG